MEEEARQSSMMLYHPTNESIPLFHVDSDHDIERRILFQEENQYFQQPPQHRNIHHLLHPNTTTTTTTTTASIEGTPFASPSSVSHEISNINSNHQVSLSAASKRLDHHDDSEEAPLIHFESKDSVKLTPSSSTGRPLLNIHRNEYSPSESTNDSRTNILPSSSSLLSSSSSPSSSLPTSSENMEQAQLFSVHTATTQPEQQPQPQQQFELPLQGLISQNDLFSVKEFYHAKTLFCTGCTGFIGKTVVEKILRCLPHVKKVYLLIRTKKVIDKRNPNNPPKIFSGHERMVNDIIKSPIMNRLIDEKFQGDRSKFEEYALEKLTCVEGDVSDVDLFNEKDEPTEESLSSGPSSKTVKLGHIRNQVNVILHIAATVGFTEPLPDALRLNVFGALNMLRFAIYCPNIQSFIHVSTCYVNSNQPSGSKIFERFYPLNLNNATVGEKQRKHRIRRLVRGYSNTLEQNQGAEDELEEMEQFCEGIFADFSFQRFFNQPPSSYKPDVTNKEDSNLMAQFTDRVLKNTKFPNTYTLTKHLAEKLVAKYHAHVPVAIVRPSIVGPAMKEPQPGWIDAVSAGAAVMLFIGLCVIRILPGRAEGIADQIPVDYVVNSILTSAVDIATRQKKSGTFNNSLLLNMNNGSYSDSNFNQNYCTQNNKKPGLLRIYHAGTSTANPGPWRKSANAVTLYFTKCPSKHQVLPNMTPLVHLLENPLNYQTQFFFRYTVWTQFFKILDHLTNYYQNTLSFLSNSKGVNSSSNGMEGVGSNTNGNINGSSLAPPTKFGKLASQLAKIEQRAHQLGSHFSHFILNEYFFDNSHVLEANNSIVPNERDYSFGESGAFGLDFDFDWDEYLELLCYGIHRYFLKEEPPYIPPQQQQHMAQQLRLAKKEEERSKNFNMKHFRTSKL
ncbi:hypothetical protein FDP41_000016 [Naegleria fowleri]|uniref:Fatty acyl-CoA reductase n=1 Tax=Naegleria fowleri TaxID=5763 RepID=A0A6A5C6Q2_NAEFO|nr:uncharacterized protein FDP41_000016 [Naegleria fowleri]KAF0984977.1 hypothetical protein FDP41_000016 [Naegleria fowleri]